MEERKLYSKARILLWPEYNGELLYISFIVVDRVAPRSKRNGDAVFTVHTHTRLAIVRQLALETSATHRGHALTRLSLDAIMRIAHGFFAPAQCVRGFRQYVWGHRNEAMDGWMAGWLGQSRGASLSG